MSRELLLVLEAAFGGIGIFLLGMRFLSDGLQALAGARLNRWIGSVADNRFLALLVGVGVTCVIQSSTATTVMVATSEYVKAPDALVTLQRYCLPEKPVPA